MRAAGKAKTVAYVSAAFLGSTAVVGGAAVALTHPGGAPSSVAVQQFQGLPPTAGGAAAVGPSSPTSAAALHVGRLKKLTPPDAIVTLSHAASPSNVKTVGDRPGVHRVVVADIGHIKLRGVRLKTLGVPLSSIRGLTPSLTAGSMPLWQSIARGELTVSYANGRRLRHHLGETVVANGPHATSSSIRIGAFATIGLDSVQALVSQPAATKLGLAHRREVMIVAPKLSLDTLTADLRAAFGAEAHIDVTRAAPVDQSVESTYATEHIPSTYLDLYRRAAVTCPGLPWTVLAAIGTVETGNGTNVHKSTAGALGPMQFIPSTWARYGYDADGDGKANIHDPTDSIFSAARYLCAAGAGLGGQSLDNAIFSYNHAWWYVREVINIANAYA